MKEIWIVEMLEDDEWVPTDEAMLTEQDAEWDMNYNWKNDHPNEKFRVRRYKGVKK